jgi:adenylate cyclase class IV
LELLNKGLNQMQREIEVKFTGFSKEDFINKLSLGYMEYISTEEQINLYYSTFTSPQLLADLGNKINYQRQIEEFIQKTQGFTYSPRIRVISKEGVIAESFLVIKGSLKDVVNGTNRMELNLAVDNYEELDEYMSSVFGVESKWDRTRNTYKATNIFSFNSLAGCILDLTITPHLYITVDMNSGYGLV